MMARSQKDKVQGAVELGPESKALLRRAVLALEKLVGSALPDPGPESETVTERDEE